MRYPNCLGAFHDVEDDWTQQDFDNTEYYVPYGRECAICPSCKMPIVVLLRYDRNVRYSIMGELTTYPPLVSKPDSISSVSEEVPYNLREDFLEARNVLLISPKASATLSRRILQTDLADQGYGNRDLAKQIDAVLTESDPTKILPNYLRPVIDAVRNFGNLSPHPVTDTTTLQIIDVEPEEAEFCLKIVEDLFDHYYIRPSVNAKKIAEFDSKLQQAGKPPVKS